MDYTQLIGLAAGFLTALSTVPQLIKTWKTRDAKDVSVGMFTALVIGIGMWVWYGVLINDIPILVTNSLAWVLNVTMLVFKFRFDGKKN